jgi:uncharacterized membrane-anchored protein
MSATMSDRARISRAVALRVPLVTASFWVIKGLSTALGESTSDWAVHAMPPVAAVLIGFVCFLAALGIQFSMGRYVPWAYWLTVVMVGIFGTMAADVLHVAFHVPYAASAVLYGLTLAAVFVSWYRVEGTLSVHDIDTPRREAFYWATVVSTFALGTAVGDLTANTLDLGYLRSALLYAAIIVVIAVAFRCRLLGPTVAFWAAYVMTRPLGASLADWLGKSTADGGLGVGAGVTSLVLAALIAISVAAISRPRQLDRRDTAARPAA